MRKCWIWGNPHFRQNPFGFGWQFFTLLVSVLIRYQKHPGWEWNSRNPISSPFGPCSDKHLVVKLVARSKRVSPPQVQVLSIYIYIHRSTIFHREKNLGNPEIHCFIPEFMRLLIKVRNDNPRIRDSIHSATVKRKHMDV